MAKDARSGKKIKEEEGNSSKNKLLYYKGSSTPGPGMTDSLTSRSFGTNAAFGKIASSSPSTRKSERLEKQTPQMTPIKRKPEKDKKHNTLVFYYNNAAKKIEFLKCNENGGEGRQRRRETDGDKGSGGGGGGGGRGEGGGRW